MQKYRELYSGQEELYRKWDECYKAYDGSLFTGGKPEWASNQVSNYIFSTVETIKPIILAQLPKIVALPQKQEHFGKSEAVQQALDYEWTRTDMFQKLHSALTIGIITGTVIVSLIWDGNQDGIGQIKPVFISPFNFLIDPMATTVEEAEICMYATYINLGQAIKFAPDKAEELRKSAGMPDDEWLTYGRNVSNASANQLLYLEVYERDYSVLSEMTDEGEVSRLQFPNGRKTIIIGDTLISDEENPYDDNGRFPFLEWKCYEHPHRFWGTGEVEHIISPQKYSNEILNVVLDSARLMSNPVWIMDKNAGIAKNSLTNRSGLVVRKNPGTEIRRDPPPPLPAYLQNISELLRQDIEHISGVYDVTRGERPTGITAAAAIQALNEQAQGRIKLKIQALETMLSKLGGMWVSRMRQFWDVDRTIRIMDDQFQPSFIEVNKDLVDGDWDIIISAGSTMPVNKAARLQQLTQLAQTPAEDGLPIVDRQTILENSELPDVRAILERFERIKQAQFEAAEQQAAREERQMAQQMQYNQLVRQHEMQQQNALQRENAQVQSNREDEKSMMLHEQAMELERLRQQGKVQEEPIEEQPEVIPEEQFEEGERQIIEMLQMLLEMDPEDVAALIEQYPELQEVIDILNRNEQPEAGLGTEQPV